MRKGPYAEVLRRQRVHLAAKEVVVVPLLWWWRRWRWRC
jgi:hypothetical protein